MPKPAHCDVCGYTKADAQYHGDHSRCSNAGNAPWERKAKRKVRLLPQSDVDEVVKFQQYLADLNGDIELQHFAEKWAEYMGVDVDTARAHVRLHRVGK